VRGKHPKRVRVSSDGRDAENGRKLWAVSEELTGVTFDFAATTR
jgi:hypothetical protein